MQTSCEDYYFQDFQGISYNAMLTFKLHIQKIKCLASHELGLTGISCSLSGNDDAFYIKP